MSAFDERDILNLSYICIYLSELTTGQTSFSHNQMCVRVCYFYIRLCNIIIQMLIDKFSNRTQFFYRVTFQRQDAEIFLLSSVIACCSVMLAKYGVTNKFTLTTIQ